MCGALARRIKVAPPVLQLACGGLLGFAPALRQVHLPPQVVLLLFLPALLYWESLTTLLREIRSNLRTIALASTVLVIVTAWAVAATAHAMGLPGDPPGCSARRSRRPMRRRWACWPGRCPAGR